MRPLQLFVIALLLAFPAVAQEEGLARDFEKLSAKERARIAKEEQAGALADAAYQTVMAQAEDLFRKLQYEASMEKFKEARSMRPYNVYPKVKIQDLQALIAKRDAENAAAQPAPGPTPAAEVSTSALPPILPNDPGPEANTVSAPVVESRLLIGGPDPKPGSPVVTPVKAVAKEEPLKVPSAAAVTKPGVDAPRREQIAVPASPLQEGERVYKEGRSVVVERTVAQEGRIVVFRKVSHPWGEVNYFRDGIAVPARAYGQGLTGR